SVSPTSIRADLEFLAADVMAGRDTPSPELEIAAQYLLSRVQRMGLQPGADGAWFQPYELERASLSEDSRLLLQCGGSRLELTPLEGFLWISCDREDADLVGSAVCIADAGKEALAAIAEGALDGRWAVATAVPKMLQTTRRRLSKAGAIGLLVIDDEQGTEDDRWYDRTRARLTPGDFRLSRTPETDEDRSALPILRLTAASSVRLRSACPELRLELGADLDLTVREQRVVQRESEAVRNICALLPGTDPERAEEVIVCSAHYDHVGVERGVVYPGADDNASGTVGLLALAEAFVARGPLERSVLFVWLSGEEQGLWGSEAFCKSPPLAEGLHVAMDLNLDMIGRTAPGELYVTPSRDHEEFNPLSELAYSLCASEGFPELLSQDEFYRASDHYNFATLLDVPVVFLSTGDHPDYHQPGDTPDKIDVDKLARVVRLSARLVEGMATIELVEPVAR
ncbi:MAG: M28 family peptidase, partial [Planctomycetes bacterium]|nr:M28 family peptidase [Planctomycetota bacterium]